MLFIKLGLPDDVWLVAKLPDVLEVCVPECHFPGNRYFPQKSRKFPVPSIREHPIPGPDSVPAFGTGCFPVSFYKGFLGKVSKFGTTRDFSERYWVVLSRPVYFPDFFWIFSSDETRKHKSCPGTADSGNEFQSCLVWFKMSSGTQTSKMYWLITSLCSLLDLVPRLQNC